MSEQRISDERLRQLWCMAMDAAAAETENAATDDKLANWLALHPKGRYGEAVQVYDDLRDCRAALAQAERERDEARQIIIMEAGRDLAVIGLRTALAETEAERDGARTALAEMERQRDYWRLEHEGKV